MSSRVTRSQAKKAGGATDPLDNRRELPSVAPSLTPQASSRQTRKRKASPTDIIPADQDLGQPQANSPRRPSKRKRTLKSDSAVELSSVPGKKGVKKSRTSQSMSDKGPDPSTPLDSTSSGKKSGRGKRGLHTQGMLRDLHARKSMCAVLI